MDVKDGLNKCDICNKRYSCYKSLWNHTKKFHNKMEKKITTLNNLITTLQQLKIIYVNFAINNIKYNNLNGNMNKPVKIKKT